MPLRKVTVRVPATTANLGPAFDCMGMALGLYSSVTLERSGVFALRVIGEGAGRVGAGQDNLLYQAVRHLYQQMGREPPPLRVTCRNAIPLARGLGSSSAAIVGGLTAANALEGGPLSQERLLRLAAALEGHPDNVAPALLGGCQIVASSGQALVTAAVPVRRGPKAVVFIPEAELSTKKARGILPAKVSRGDAVHNIGRAALLVAALSQGRWELLRAATEDRLHQPARSALVPGMGQVFAAALGAGAHGVFLSGAGPSLTALVTGDPAPVGKAMTLAAQKAGVKGSWRALRAAARGAHVAQME
jgi:homoserine kinase